MNNSMMKTVGRSLALMGVVTLVGGGCVSTSGRTAYREVNEREDYALVQEKLRRLEGDMESLTMQLEQVRQDLQRIQANRAHASSAQTATLQASLNSVQDRLNGLEAQREADRREIVDTLSRKVAELVNAAAPAPVRTGARAASGGSGFGYEHIVQSGETLSRIAQAYGTTVSAILSANGLQNADTLQVGQKLIIPE